MGKQRKEDPPPAGSPAWMATFGDLMNLLLCFFVLLFSMSSVDAQKFELIAASFNDAFSIFSAGATAIGDGILVSNGVSQLNELDQYVSSMGKGESGEDIEDDTSESLNEAAKAIEEIKLGQSEQLAELVTEALAERDIEGDVAIEFTAQYVQLTLNGALLFDSGSVELKEEAIPLLDHISAILQRYQQGMIEIEGHTDNVPMSGVKYSNNDELSQGRALSVFNYIIEHTSLDPANVKNAGRGEYAPIADNSTPEGRAKNRRVEIRIYNSLSAY